MSLKQFLKLISFQADEDVCYDASPIVVYVFTIKILLAWSNKFSP